MKNNLIKLKLKCAKITQKCEGDKMSNKIFAFLAVFAFFVGCGDDEKKHSDTYVIEDEKLNMALKNAENDAKNNSSSKGLEVISVLPDSDMQKNTPIKEDNISNSDINNSDLERKKFEPILDTNITQIPKVENPEAIIKVPKDKLIRRLKEE